MERSRGSTPPGRAGRAVRVLLVTALATWSAAASGQDDESVTCEPTDTRPGRCQPFGEAPPSPLLPDEEAIVVWTEGPEQVFAVQDALADSPGLKVVARRTAGRPVVARGGRVLGLPYEQLVLISQSDDGLLLEVLSFLACPSGPCPEVLAEHVFSPSNPDSSVSLHVAPLAEDDKQEAILLAYETEDDARQARAHVTLLRVSDAQPALPPELQGEAPPGDRPVTPEVVLDRTLDVTAPGVVAPYNLGLLRHQDGSENRLRARIMQIGLEDPPPAVLVAHATPDDRLAMLPLSVPALADGADAALVEALEALPLTTEAADADAWEVAVARIGNSASDGVFVARRQDAATLDLRAFRLKQGASPQCSPGDRICIGGPSAGMPCNRQDECLRGPDTLPEFVPPWQAGLCSEGPNCPAVDLLAAPMLASLSPDAPYEWDNRNVNVALLLQTDRGPIVQTFRIENGEPPKFEPVEDGIFTWPRGGVALNARGNYAEAPVTGGGLAMQVANVVHHRATANRYGTGRGSQNSAPNFQDRRPSLYVTLPDASPFDELGHLLRVRAVFGSDDELERGPHCQGPMCELQLRDADGSVSAGADAIVGTADIDGDSGYYRLLPTTPAATPSEPNSHRLYLSLPTHLTLRGLKAPEVILEEPPKHVDYLRDPEGGRVHNVSQSSDFTVAYRNAMTRAVEVKRETSTSVTYGDRTTDTLGAKMSGVVKLLSGAIEGSVTQTVTSEATTLSADLSLDTTRTTLSQTFETSNDDQLLVVVRDVDIWRFPSLGLRGAGEADAEGTGPKQPFFELVIPGEGSRSAESGRNAALYQPRHINGNALSYPRFDRDSDTEATRMQDLQPFSLGGDCINGTCLGGPSDGVSCRAVSECEPPAPTEAPLWAESSFDVSADSTTTLSLVESSTNEERLRYQNRIAESRGFTVAGSLGVEIPGVFSSGLSAQRDYSVSAGHSFSAASVATNTTSALNEIALSAPPLGAPEETYTFLPAFYFDRSGAVKVSHHVSLPTGQASFWSERYAGPDPALNLPRRIRCDGEACELNAGSSRHALKGVFIRFDEEDLRDRHLVTTPPPAGTQLRIEVQVYNLSVGMAVERVTARFEVQAFQDDGEADGIRTPIGERVIEDLAPGGMQLAAASWDTTGFGDSPSGEPRTYRIYVTLDPDNDIPDETHEWLDRDDDPLLNSAGDPLDPRGDRATGPSYLEKGQNNEGWTAITLLPSDATCDDRPDPCGPAQGPRDFVGALSDAGTLDAGDAGDAGDSGAHGDGDGCGCRLVRGHGSVPVPPLAAAIAALALRLRRRRHQP